MEDFEDSKEGFCIFLENFLIFLRWTTLRGKINLIRIKSNNFIIKLTFIFETEMKALSHNLVIVMKG